MKRLAFVYYSLCLSIYALESSTIHVHFYIEFKVRIHLEISGNRLSIGLLIVEAFQD